MTVSGISLLLKPSLFQAVVTHLTFPGQVEYHLTYLEEAYNYRCLSCFTSKNSKIWTCNSFKLFVMCTEYMHTYAVA